MDTVIALGRPLAAVINRADLGDDEIRTFCAQRGIPILVELPDDRAAAEAYATGEIIGRRLPAFGALFEVLLDAILARDAGRSRRAE